MTDYKNWETGLSCRVFDKNAFDMYKSCGIELVEILEDIDYSGPFLYELSLGGKTSEEFSFPAIDIRCIRENHMNIKSFTGAGKKI